MAQTRGRTHGARAGMAVLYTEHNMDAVFGVADRVLVIIDGVIAAQGSPQQIARDPAVRQRYLGDWWERSRGEVAHA
jgi:branched-chain amino acid transport system ATP-binding protein